MNYSKDPTMETGVRDSHGCCMRKHPLSTHVESPPNTLLDQIDSENRPYYRGKKFPLGEKVSIRRETKGRCNSLFMQATVIVSV
jgi:hypothetical protein